MWKARWESGDGREGASCSELDTLLDDLHRQCDRNRPILVAVEASNGNTLTIGVGGESSVLSFVAASGDAPYLSSAGAREDEGTMVFYYMGEWTEIPKRKLVSHALARQAMRSFVETGGVTNGVRWETD